MTGKSDNTAPSFGKASLGGSSQCVPPSGLCIASANYPIKRTRTSLRRNADKHFPAEPSRHITHTQRYHTGTATRNYSRATHTRLLHNSTCPSTQPPTNKCRPNMVDWCRQRGTRKRDAPQFDVADHQCDTVRSQTDHECGCNQTLQHANRRAYNSSPHKHIQQTQDLQIHGIPRQTHTKCHRVPMSHHEQDRSQWHKHLTSSSAQSTVQLAAFSTPARTNHTKQNVHAHPHTHTLTYTYTPIHCQQLLRIKASTYRYTTQVRAYPHDCTNR